MRKNAIISVINQWSKNGEKIARNLESKFSYTYHVEEISDGALIVVTDWALDKDEDLYPPHVCAILYPKKIAAMMVSNGSLTVEFMNGDTYGLHVMEPVWYKY